MPCFEEIFRGNRASCVKVELKVDMSENMPYFMGQFFPLSLKRKCFLLLPGELPESGKESFPRTFADENFTLRRVEDKNGACFLFLLIFFDDVTNLSDCQSSNHLRVHRSGGR